MNDTRASLILPFLKQNPFEDYTLVDTQILADNMSTSPVTEISVKYLGFYKQTGILVEIEKQTLLRCLSQTWVRIEAFIKCLQRNMMQLFDFVIEEGSEDTGYINVYLIRQAGE